MDWSSLFQQMLILSAKYSITTGRKRNFLSFCFDRCSDFVGNLEKLSKKEQDPGNWLESCSLMV